LPRNRSNDATDSRRTDLCKLSAAPVAVISSDLKVGLDIELPTNPTNTSHYQLVVGSGLLYSVAQQTDIGLTAYGFPALSASSNAWNLILMATLTHRF